MIPGSVKLCHRKARCRQSTLALVAAFLSSSTIVNAQPEPTSLVDQQHCMFCHTDNAAFLAPSFQQIAERYRDVPNAASMLEHKLRMGGRAHWGDTPMPLAAERGGPLSAEDAHTLVQWVLSH
jgi:cytochrome c